MNKKIVIFSLLLAGLITSGFAYAALNGDAVTDSTKPPTNQQQKAAAPVARNENVPGKYVDYSQNEVASDTNTKLLFFHAPWCSQCRALEADIKKDGVPNGVTIFKVDYDSNQKLRQQYGVTLQTTFVRLNDNQQADAKYVAYDDPTLDNVVKNLL